MPTLTYALVNVKNDAWNSDGSSCGNWVFPSKPAQYVTRDIANYSQRIGERGNFVEATPYWARFEEVSPFEGSLSVTNRYKYTADTHFEKCGSKAGNYWRLSVDPGYLFDPRVSSFPEDPEIEQFVMGYSRTQALASLRERMMNIPLLYAERVQTAQMISKRASQLASDVNSVTDETLRRYRRLKGQKKKQFAKDAANAHLELLFGWLPLMQELAGAANIYTEPLSTTITGRGRRSDVVAIDTATTNLWRDMDHFLLDRYRFPHLRTTKGFDRISARTSQTYTVEARVMRRLRQMGFNPLASAFDLIPLSFVANFVSNLGAYIAAHDPMPDATFVRGNTTLWRESRRDYTLKPCNYFYKNGSIIAEAEDIIGQSAGWGRCLNVVRTVHNAPPDPELFWANNLSVAKAFTSASLGIQRAVKPVVAANKALRAFRYKGPRPKWLPPIKYTGTL